MAALGDHVDIERGHRGVHTNQESSDEHEEELVLVVTNPALANLIYYTCVSASLDRLRFCNFVLPNALTPPN